MSNRQPLVRSSLTAADLPAPEHARGWRIVMHEVCAPEDRGSIGCNYVMEQMRAAGWTVEYGTDGPADVELVSVHHCTDYPAAAALPRRGRIRLVGGHAMAINPRPLIPFSDAICIGEGETWILRALRLLAEEFTPAALATLPGTIVSAHWQRGSTPPPPNMEFPLPRNRAYLNRAAAGHAPTWYLEMARGCPFSCHYCELGHLTRYRIQDTNFLLSEIDALDVSRSRRISLFAPDEASHPGYGDILQRIHDRRLVTSFGSMRIEQVIRRGLPLKPNMLIRVGMDGLTETTRFRVGRKQTDQYFLDYFMYMSERGHSNFKIFMIVGYPWEEPADLDSWISLMTAIGMIPRRRASAHVRIKITPLIPQPGTPLAGAAARYDRALIDRMERWIRMWRPQSTPGWYFEQDGRTMSELTWRTQCALTAGDEDILLRARRCAA